MIPLPTPALLGRVSGALGERILGAVPTADLDDRDPDYIRDNLPGLWLLATIWHRAEVRGLEHIPEEGPVLLVGNHCGGNVSPDTLIFTLAFSARFGVERTRAATSLGRACSASVSAAACGCATPVHSAPG